jgi:hypothetical protein
MNRKAFSAVISDIAYECCHGEFLPDSLKIKLIKCSDGTAQISFEADLTSENRENAVKGDILDEMFRNYLIEAFSEKYKALYSEEKSSHKEKHIIEFPIINSNVGSLRAPSDYSDRPSDDTIRVRMRKFINF